MRETQLTQLGISLEQIENTLAQQNVVVDSGGFDLRIERPRIEQTGEFRSPQDIENLVLRGSTVQEIIGGANTGVPRSGSVEELVRIKDVGTVARGYTEPPTWAMRYDGEPAIALAISNVSGVNVVDLGRALDQRLHDMSAMLPVGLEVHKVSWQSDLVTESINDFMISLAQAVGIVLIVLWLAMGLRTALIVGFGGLVFVIIASFLVMYLWKIDLQRMSLGALVIAMGMMVDNAIVVADGVLVRMQKGMDRTQAAIEAATLPAWPLLGATFIAVMAFYPIYASDQSAGEYCRSLFQVVAISLLLSWLLSVTITPLMCIWLLPTPKQSVNEEAMYGGRMYVAFRSVLNRAIRFRYPVVGGLLALLVVSLYCFQYVDRTFFPDSARLQVMLEYWAPQGTKIQTVAADVRRVEQRLMGDPKVDCVSTFLGQGPPRFYLPVDPELAYQSYAQLIINVHDLEGLNLLIPEMDSWIQQEVSEALMFFRRYGLGPSQTWKVEARISGPAIADPDTLRGLAAQSAEIMKESPNAEVVRTDWRQRIKKIVADYNQQRARWSRISRADIARATQRAYDGYAVGQFRERDKLLPIFLRNSQRERQQLADSINVLQVHPAMSSDTVPLSQVTTGIDVRWEDPIVWRRNRRRTVTVQANPPDGVPASVLLSDVKAGVESIDLPPGYTLEWGGESEDSRDAQMSLIPGIVPAGIVVALVVVALFNAFRPPLIIACLIPFALIGVTVGLLTTGQPFGFLALLGAMSLAGMMTKNAIVLLDEIDIQKKGGKSEYQAVMDAALSRLRPVMLAAGTTVLGVVPLLQDVFWVAMAVTIMFGLAFGSILTMVLLPVLYACFFPDATGD